MFKQTKILSLILLLGLFSQKSLTNADCVCTSRKDQVNDAWCSATCYTSAGVNTACDPNSDDAFRFCDCTGCKDDSSSEDTASTGGKCKCESITNRVDTKWCAESCYTKTGLNIACNPDTELQYQLCSCKDCTFGDDSSLTYVDPDVIYVPTFEWVEFVHDLYDNWPDYERSAAWEVTNEKEQPLGQFSFFCNEKVMGGQGRWGNINWWRDLTTAKGTFTGLPTHNKLKISYNLNKYGTWAEDESVELYINDNIVKSHYFATGTACSDMEHKDETVIEIEHDSDEIVIEFRTGFDEKSEIWTQAWGISDFYIHTGSQINCYHGYQTCSSTARGAADTCNVGFTLNEKIGHCEGEAGFHLFEENWSSHDFTTDGWEVVNFNEGVPKTSPYTYCLDSLVRFDNVRMLGGASAFCNIDFGESRSYISKTFKNLPVHYNVKIEYDLHFMWGDSDWADDEEITLRSGWTELVHSKQADEGTIEKSCGETNRKVVHVEAEMLHFEKDLPIKIDTNLKFEGCFLHSWGINNFKLYVENCHESCGTCTGTGETECMNCTKTADKWLDGVCEEGTVCLDGLYADDKFKCQKCNAACETCEGPGSSMYGDGCTKCAEGYEMDSIGECYKCDGYELEGVCKPCKHACKTCDGPTIFLNSAYGCLTCNDGYYEGNGDSCSPCEPQCKTCDARAMTCTSCYDGAFVSAEMTCDCKDGYQKGAKGACVKCHTSCQKCNLLLPHICTECPEGKELDSNDHCICEENSLLDERAGTCVPCS